MITLKRTLEIFSESNFKKTARRILPNGRLTERYELKNLSADGKYHYEFLVKETEFNSGATINFGKWEPMRSFTCCCDICDEDFLLHIIEECKQGIL
jgi:hypothetical protein